MKRKKACSNNWEIEIDINKYHLSKGYVGKESKTEVESKKKDYKENQVEV